MQIYDILKQDHRQVMEIMDTIGPDMPKDHRKHIITLVHTELAMHSKAEEEVFYRPLRERLKDDTAIEHSFDDHDEIDRLLARLQFTSADNDEWMQYLNDLRSIVREHVAKEESDIFVVAQKHFSEAEAEQMAENLLAEKGKLGMPNPISVAAHKLKEAFS